MDEKAAPKGLIVTPLRSSSATKSLPNWFGSKRSTREVFTLHRRIASLRHLVINTIADAQPFAFRVAGSGRLQLSWCTVTRHPTAKWLARQVTKAFSWDKAPTGIVRDNNIALDSNFIRRILALSIRSRSNSFRSPW